METLKERSLLRIQGPLGSFFLRGLGTLLRTDPVFLGMTKTRLLDPVLWKPGTNDNPGDYRHSGCTACHVIYANDRDPLHSAQYAEFGNRGYYAGEDESIPKNESGHPITHQMTRAIPSSQCMVCHVHPGTNMEMTYYGNIWYDNESDGDLLYPEVERELTWAETFEIQQRNPQGAALRGKWSDPEFLAKVEAFTGWLRQQPEVRQVMSISDTFKRLNKNLHGVKLYKFAPGYSLRDMYYAEGTEGTRPLDSSS